VLNFGFQAPSVGLQLLERQCEEGIDPGAQRANRA